MTSKPSLPNSASLSDGDDQSSSIEQPNTSSPKPTMTADGSDLKGRPSASISDMESLRQHATGQSTNFLTFGDPSDASSSSTAQVPTHPNESIAWGAIDTRRNLSKDGEAYHGYATHLPVLARALHLLPPEPTILDLGVGWYSSPMIQTMRPDATHYAFDHNHQWTEKIRTRYPNMLRLPFREPQYLWDFVSEASADLVFIDHGPRFNARLHTLNACSANQSIGSVVIHDVPLGRYPVRRQHREAWKNLDLSAWPHTHMDMTLTPATCYLSRIRPLF